MRTVYFFGLPLVLIGLIISVIQRDLIWSVLQAVAVTVCVQGLVERR